MYMDYIFMYMSDLKKKKEKKKANDLDNWIIFHDSELLTPAIMGGGWGVKLFGIWDLGKIFGIWDLRLINLNMLSEIHILLIYKILDIGWQ